MKWLTSFKVRLFLIISVTFLFWILISLFFIDRTTSFYEINSLSVSVNRIKKELIGLSFETEIFARNADEIFKGRISSLSKKKIDAYCSEITNSLDSISNEPLFVSDTSLNRKISELTGRVKELNFFTDELIKYCTERGNVDQGILKKWNEKLHLILSSSTNLNKDLIEKIKINSEKFLQSSDPDFLQQISDQWNSVKAAVSNDPEINNLLKNILSDFFSLNDQLIILSHKIGYPSGTGLSAEINQTNLQIHELGEDIYTDLNTLSISSVKKSLRQFIWSVFLAGIILLIVLYLFIRKSHNSLMKLKDFLILLRSGQIPEKIQVDTHDELGQMAEYLNMHSDALNRKIKFADDIGKNNIHTEYQPESEKDILGNSLLKITNRLKQAQEKDLLYKSEEEIRRWNTEGMAMFGEILRSERDNLTELSFKTIKALVNYLEAEQGALYLIDKEIDHTYLNIVAAFAFDRRKYLNKRIEIGEGLIGTCAIEKETIFLTDIPANYPEIISGLGKSSPCCILIVPMKIEKDILGIIEIASFRMIQRHQIKFAEVLGESIASTLAAVRVNEETSRLLSRSRKQAEEFLLQEEKMRLNLEELKRLLDESQKKDAEIESLLNALNSSSPVAEYNLNGRFSNINDKYLLLLGSSRESVIGRHHSDYAVVDKYSEEYKLFWQNLKEGKPASITELFRLFDGQELWLYNTYTPIIDKNDQVYKILNIAQDITQNRNQSEYILNQANQIIRKDLEIEAISNAIGQSLLIAELTPDALILNINEKYSEITGYSSKEILGKSIRLFLKDEEKQEFEKIWNELLNGRSYAGIIRRTRPGGEAVWLLSTFNFVKDETGNIYKVIFLAQDITEKKLQDQLLANAILEIDNLKRLLNTNPESK